MRPLNAIPHEVNQSQAAPEPARDHECDDGWIYTTAGVERCPTCQANTEATRIASEIHAAGVGERYWTTSWTDLEMVDPLPSLQAAAVSIVDILATGDHLLLSGKPGSGKTQAAVLLIRAAIEARKTAKLLNLGRAAMQIRAAYKTDDGPTESSVVKEASRVDLLVIDDLGAGETGAATLEQRILYLVLEERQNTRRSTVVTTNLTPQEVKDRLGQRLTGRLQPLAIMQFTHGRNFRRPAGKTSWETT